MTLTNDIDSQNLWMDYYKALVHVKYRADFNAARASSTVHIQTLLGKPGHETK